MFSQSLSLRIARIPTAGVTDKQIPYWKALGEFTQAGQQGESLFRPIRLEAYGEAATELEQLSLDVGAQFVGLGRVTTQVEEDGQGNKKKYFVFVMRSVVFGQAEFAAPVSAAPVSAPPAPAPAPARRAPAPSPAPAPARRAPAPSPAPAPAPVYDSIPF